MDVRKDFANAVSKQWTSDGVVVPTNDKYVFVTHAVNNLDESGLYNSHGIAKTLVSHLTHAKMKNNPPPPRLDFLKAVHILLPDDYAIVPHIDEYAADVARLGAG